MLSKKGKRTLVFKDSEYGWFVKKINDEAFLSISSTDKKLVISYRVNQISDEYIHPEITLLQSAKIPPGVYAFFPPLADESVSAANVRAILKWYFKQVETQKREL